MKKAAYFNFKNYRSAVLINILPSELTYPTKNYVLDDFSSAESDAPIYFTPHGEFNYLFYTSEPIYLNRNCVGLAKDLTKLNYCILFNTNYFNYKYVTNMHTAFTNCFNITNHPIMPKNVISCYGMYYDCRNITGSPKIGNNTHNLIATYYNCQNLNGTIPNIAEIDMMVGTYYNCCNLTGALPSDIQAKSMYEAFYNCYQLEGQPSNCNNAFITINTYYNCPNIYGEFYWCLNSFHQAKKVNMTNMFYNRDPSQMLTIYAWENYAIANALLNYSAAHGNLYGTGAITWAQTDTLIYYNSQYNTRLILLEDGDNPDSDS